MQTLKIISATDTEKTFGKVTLSPHQQLAYDQVVRFVQDVKAEAGVMALAGYAGTGKTTLVGRLISELAPALEIVVAAPTHKALSVLKTKIETEVEFRTVHSLLGYRMVADEDVKKARRDSVPTITAFDLVVIDESSMIGETFYRDLLTHRGSTRILFVGDPAQLPPVNDGLISPVFANVRHQVRLTEVVRQAAENPIIALSMRIREAQEQDRPISPGELQAAIPAPPANVGLAREQDLVAWAISEQRDGRDCRVLAWTNRRVQTINALVHEGLHGVTAVPFAPGERAIVHEQRDSVRLADDIGVRVTLRTSEELVIESMQAVAEGVAFVAVRDGGQRIKGVLMDEAKQAEVARRFAAAREIADKAQRGKAMQSAFAYKESFIDLRHAYAMTTHKSQGSTFDTALVDVQDLARMPPQDFNRALYVAVTRPREFLALAL